VLSVAWSCSDFGFFVFHIRRFERYAITVWIDVKSSTLLWLLGNHNNNVHAILAWDEME
jgi:hypothetical protein